MMHKFGQFRFGPGPLIGACVWLAAACGDESGGAAGGNPMGSAGSPNDSGQDHVIVGDSGVEDASIECPRGCPEGQVCISGFCVTQTSCTGADECQNDTYCKPDAGCVPWGHSPHMDFDSSCQSGLPSGIFTPTVKCEFKEAPAGDPFPAHLDVQATPIVVNFNAQGTGVPSIVAPFSALEGANYTEDLGVIRVLRGDNCELEANLGGGEAGHAGFLMSPSPVAVGDLDGDGFAEIVATAADGRMVAFSRKAGIWSRLWVSSSQVVNACAATRCPKGRGGPSIHDLDDDGIPEVIREGAVSDGLTGLVRSDHPPNYSTYSSGLNPVLANLDQDPAIELTDGRHVWEWTAGAWIQDAVTLAPGPGFVAVANFGAYGQSLPEANPEVVVVRSGLVEIYAMDGSVVLGVPVPGGGGGAPTVADYDGDGLPEVAVAGQAFLTVFDLDCGPAPRPSGTCQNQNACEDTNGVPGPCPAGVLWSRRTQDISSNVTGSSVFDFEGDGKAEVVYADECFVRVYDGTDGSVLFSQFRSSCTWYENPVVADTDGNFRANLVTPSNLACGDGLSGIACNMLDANGVDAQFAGLRCLAAADCASGLCQAGLCRCTTTSQCCAAASDAGCLDAGFKCAPPPAGTAGSGNTCRAAHPRGVTGIRVYSDAKDGWVRSRTIWNQHTYHVTHVNEDGTVPSTSTWQKNWLDPQLNNFRQNVPGHASGQDIADLTAGVGGFNCTGSVVSLSAPICNRGSAPVGASIPVGFYHGQTLLCSEQTSKALAPGECVTVSCVAKSAPTAPADVKVVADDGDANMECNEGNNTGSILGVACNPPR